MEEGKTSNIYNDTMINENYQINEREFLTNLLESLGYEVNKPIRPTEGVLHFRKDKGGFWIAVYFNPIVEEMAILPIQMVLEVYNMEFDDDAYDTMACNAAAPVCTNCRMPNNNRIFSRDLCLPVKSLDCKTILGREIDRLERGKEHYLNLENEIPELTIDPEIVSEFRDAISY